MKSFYSFTVISLLVFVTAQTIAGNKIKFQNGEYQNKTLRVEELTLPIQDRQLYKFSTSLTPLNLSARSFISSSNAISGIKRIGVGQDYETINEAITDLNVNGVTGSVIFLLTDASYNEPGMLMLPIIGGSETNTVTLQPDSNVGEVEVTLTNNAEFGGGLVLAGASYFTLDGTKKNGTPGSRDLTVRFDQAQSFPTSPLDAPIRIRDGCSHVTIKNSKVLSMYDGNQTSARPGVSMTTSLGPNNDITIENNLISRASFGIRTIAGNDFDQQLTIMGNDIGGGFFSEAGNQTDYVQICGIFYEFTDGAVISNNRVVGVQRNNSATAGADAGLRTSGIWQNFSVNSIVSHNIVDDVRSIFSTSSTSINTRIYGMRIVGLTTAFGSPYPNTNNVMFNNCVTRIYGTGATAFRDFCMSVEVGEGDFIYNNSMSHSGTHDGGAVVLQLTGDNTTSGDFTVLNNAFENSRAGNSLNCIYRIFDNSGLPDLTRANYNVLYNPVNGSIDADGQSWPGWISGYPTHPDSESSPYNPYFFSIYDLHIDSTQASAAENLARPVSYVTIDIDGQGRDIATPDAGYDEVDGVSTLDKDVMPVSFISPTGAGFPKGLPVPSVRIKYRNNTLFPASYTAKVRIFDPNDIEVAGSPFSTNVTAKPGLSFTDVTIPLTFTPSSDGFYTFEAISDLSGDMFPENDTLEGVFLAVPLIALGTGYCTTFETEAEQLGWFGDNDFELVDFTKLGGPRSGSHAWVTVAGPPGTHYSEGGVVSHVYSPFFDFTGVTTAYVGFYHSIMTEPNWDRSIMEYSLDSGRTWRVLGVLNDPDGINWYNEGTYQNAAGDTVNCFDIGRARREGFPVGAPGWTSNGDCEGDDVSTGPYGYVYTELKLPGAILNRTYVRFRYSAFSDGFVAEDGWALDDFCIGLTGSTANASLSGKKFLDNNGNGVYEPGLGEPTQSGIVIELFGSASALDTTDSNGDYSFSSLLPGLYGVREQTIPVGTAVTLPAEGEYQGISLAPGEVVTGLDFGNFESIISGTKFNDLNDNAANDGEPGLSNWAIEILSAEDSSLVKSTVTDAFGDYNFSVPPGNYLIREVIKQGWRQTYPSLGGWYTDIFVDTISGGTNISGKDFGNFEFGRLRVECTIDLNGNGIKEIGDVLALPSGTTAAFTLSRNGVPIETAILGNGVSSFIFDSLNQGIYRIVEALPSGWIRTAGGVLGTFTKVITIGSVKDTARYLNFKLNTVTGQKFNDLNGNGVKEAGEPGLGGWRILLTGAATASTTTDSLGFYTFTDLGPGSYSVAESLQTGWRQTMPGPPGTYTITANGAPQLAVHANRNFGNTLTVSVADDEKELPKVFALHQNYPNPFNPQTKIRFEIPDRAHVVLHVYNLMGQEVATLLDATKEPGRYDVIFDASELSTGIYFYRLNAGNYTSVRKLILVK